MTGVLVRREDRQTQGRRPDRQAETGKMNVQAKDKQGLQKPLDARREAGRDRPLVRPETAWPCGHLHRRPPAAGTLTMSPCRWSRPVGGALLKQPQGADCKVPLSCPAWRLFHLCTVGSGEHVNTLGLASVTWGFGDL